MKLKEIIIGVVAVALVALVAVGATLAYLTATDEETNVMTVGDVEIEILEFERVSTDTSGVDAQLQAFKNDKKLIPSIVPAEFDYTKKEATVNWDKDKDENEIKKGYTSAIWDPEKIRSEEDKMVFVKNTGKHTDAYVRLYFAFEAGQYASFEQFQNKIHLNINETDWDWTWDKKLAEIKGMKCFVACATYKTAIAPGELTNISLSQIALDVNATNADSASFGDKYDVLLVAQGIQSEEMGTPEAALNNGFGTDVPFAGFRYVDFTTLKTALHNLNGVANNTITSKVNSVTFGLFRDHYEKIIGYDGVATKNVDNQEKFSAYTYYVPTSDGKYDIYVLTDAGKIYTPEDSERLFQGMTVLTKVDTANLDVSKTTCMNYMFSKCSALAEIDVSKWDVSNVTTMYYMFERCSSLVELAVSEWNVQKVWRMEYTFFQCSALTSDKFDVSKWDVSAVSSFGGMFSGCASLTTLDLSKWQTVSATKMWEMFHGCKSLTTLEISNFNVSGVASVANMFNGCASLAKIDLSYWNTANFNDTKNMFAYCRKLTTIYVGQGWNLSGVTVNDNGKSQHSGMFTEDTNLVGGMGTTLIKNELEQYITDKTYACIDGGTSNPGYLTQGPAPANP
jgi:predicted ribosomally synthesized peptide with SipW-like signal peptide